MKKIIVLLFTSLMMMSGCSAEKLPRSDEQIQADCLKVQAIQSNLVELVSFKVNTKTFEGEYFVVRSSIDLLTDTEEVKADVLMKYKKHDQTWYVDYSEINITGVITSALPSETLARSVLNGQDLLFYQYGNVMDQSQSNGMDQNNLTVTLDQNTGNGKITYHFSYDGGNLILSWKNEGTVLLAYDLNKGWIPSIQEQTYTETMDWNGVYRMDFYTTPGTDMPDPIDIKLTGTMTMDVDAQGKETVTGNLNGQFTINGTEYNVEGEIDRVTENYFKPNPKRIRFVYGNNDEALTLLVSFYEAPDDTWYEGSALNYNGYVYKLD